MFTSTFQEIGDEMNAAPPVGIDGVVDDSQHTSKFAQALGEFCRMMFGSVFVGIVLALISALISFYYHTFDRVSNILEKLLNP